MKFFKFNWFSSKERELLLKEKAEIESKAESLAAQNRQLSSELMYEKGLNEYRELPKAPDKPYKNLYYTDGSLTIVSHEGDVICKTGIPQAALDLIKKAASFDNILSLLSEKVTDKGNEEGQDIIQKNASILDTCDDFVHMVDGYIMKGVNLVIPPIVLASFIEILEKRNHGSNGNLDDEYQALKMFWLKLALNGMEQSRNDLLNFVKKNDIKITKNGNLILYRRIVSKSRKSKGLTKFVSLTYYNTKKISKKSPKDFDVYKHPDNGFFLKHIGSVKQVQGTRIGNLAELYKNPDLNNENVFTSWHSRDKHTIKVGSVYQINENEINTNNGLCAAGGLHAAAVNYDYSGFGDTPVVVLVSPSKTITVPKEETGKLRTTEMFIACINDKPHGIHFDEKTIAAFDEEYNNFTINELEEALRDKSFSVASVESYISPIKFTDIQTIKDLLKQRVVKS